MDQSSSWCCDFQQNKTTHIQGIADVELALPLVFLFVIHARFQSHRARRAVEVSDDYPKS